MKKNVLLYVLAGALLMVLFTTGCNLKKDDTIVFDETHPLALAPDVSWAVVTDPYATYRKNYGWKEAGEGHCRRGEILQVQGKSIGANKEVWYSFEQGWLPASSISVFDNRYKAETYGKQLDK